jgi:hypothetical protein
MKKLASMLVALGLAVAFTAPAFAAGPAAQPLTKSDCKKSGLKWNDQANVCGKGRI